MFLTYDGEHFRWPPQKNDAEMVYKKCSLSITSFTSKLINDSLKSGFCNALQQKRQNISIILLKSPPFNFLIGKYASLIKSGRIIF